ncbi:MAG: Hsp33 family molecular chaperone HslO, partial [Xanthomonadales bacterium]|nr:Hsp33 family molecular chaperone HslO [Xanthomonadales bacterium]
AWQQVRRRNPAPEAPAGLLGEALAASALMFSNVKLKGQIALQLQGGSGPVNLLLAQCTDQGTVRGIVDYTAENETSPSAFRDLVANSVLAINMEQAHSQTRYQGIVELSGDCLGAALEGYFDRSEQLPSRIKLAADGSSAGGLLLQRLPGEMEDADGWNRLSILAETLTGEELLALEGEEILRRLFHREAVRVDPVQPLAFGCRCNRERVVQVLRALGEEDLEQATDARGAIDVNCQFCNELYRFDAVDLGQILNSTLPVGETPNTRQ